MTAPSSMKVNRNTPLNQITRLLLSSAFAGIPVVDEERRPVVGGDLIYKEDRPLRMGRPTGSIDFKTDKVLTALEDHKGEQKCFASHPVVIEQNQPATEAVDLASEENSRI